MRYLVFVTMVLACAAAERVAWAQTFGGFAADDTAYLVGRDQVCRPLAAGASSPSNKPPACERKGTAEVAAMKFRRGTKQAGPNAAYQAETRGNSLMVRAIQAKIGVAEVASFTSIDPIARVIDVYLSERGTLVAVEYEVRFAGSMRREVVAFHLPRPANEGNPAKSQPAPGGAANATTGTAATGGAELPASPALEKALAKARGLDKQGRAQPALAAYRSALVIDPQSSEAHYGAARQLAKQKQHAEAVAALEAIAGAQRSDAVIWLVEARFDNAFAPLRGDARFRKATGLDPVPGSAPSLYERLLGFSSTWEQPEVKCEQAEVRLTFTRLARAFELKVTSRCGGYKDVQTMRGRFALADPSRVELTLPNKGGSDEAIACELKACTGEDCLYCMLDRDLEMVLRVVRR